MAMAEDLWQEAANEARTKRPSPRGVGTSPARMGRAVSLLQHFHPGSGGVGY